MVRYFFALLCISLFLNTSAFTQEVSTNDTIQKEEFLVGIFDRQQLQKEEFGEYFVKEYSKYEPCTDALQELKKSIYNKSITVVLATWCHDSKIQLGRFYKILDMLDYDTRNISNYCLDKEKTAGDLDISIYSIEKVPTFIFYDGKKEIGRIIESPNTSLEKDMVKILNH